MCLCSYKILILRVGFFLLYSRKDPPRRAGAEPPRNCGPLGLTFRRGGLFAPFLLCAPTPSAVADFFFFLYHISTQHFRKANFFSQKIAFKVLVGKMANARG